MRGIARQKLGYYPLPQNEAERIRRFLSFHGDAVSVLDPCAGAGAAMATITSGAKTVRHAIELDAFRAEEACSVLDHVIQGNCFDVHSAVESFSLLFENHLTISRWVRTATVEWNTCSSITRIGG